MKNIVVLGSTGSIGTQTLDVVRANPEKFNILALCACTSVSRLNEQLAEFRPQYVGVCDEAAASQVKAGTARLFTGSAAAEALAALPEADVVVNAICGFSGLAPLLSALKAGKTVATANKESIVCAHTLVDEAVARYGGKLIPVDSEQCAIFQCLEGRPRESVKRLILTASGGAFRGRTRKELENVTATDALRHPTWKMGKKITIDSATLFNKGLEIMEAAYLFGVSGERIDVLIHPQSIVHSMVEYVDNSVIAQLSKPDMRLDIQYALSYPSRIPGEFGALDLAAAGCLEFYKPDCDIFRALPLAYAALREGGALPVAYNAANEAAVALFMENRLKFFDIPCRVEYAMDRIGGGRIKSIEDIQDIDAQARRLAMEVH